MLIADAGAEWFVKRLTSSQPQHLKKTMSHIVNDQLIDRERERLENLDPIDVEMECWSGEKPKETKECKFVKGIGLVNCKIYQEEKETIFNSKKRFWNWILSKNY